MQIPFRFETLEASNQTKNSGSNYRMEQRFPEFSEKRTNSSLKFCKQNQQNLYFTLNFGHYSSRYQKHWNLSQVKLVLKRKGIVKQPPGEGLTIVSLQKWWGQMTLIQDHRLLVRAMIRIFSFLYETLGAFLSTKNFGWNFLKFTHANGIAFSGSPEKRTTLRYIPIVSISVPFYFSTGIFGNVRSMGSTISEFSVNFPRKCQ